MSRRLDERRGGSASGVIALPLGVDTSRARSRDGGVGDWKMEKIDLRACNWRTVLSEECGELGDVGNGDHVGEEARLEAKVVSCSDLECLS